MGPGDEEFDDEDESDDPDNNEDSDDTVYDDDENELIGESLDDSADISA